jgi:hypothetical protein
MAYTLEQNAVFEYRVKRVKTGLKKRKIKYYVPAALALNHELKASQLRNVMNAGLKNEKALAVLEQLAGINTPASQAVAV